jgi:hypothetical protein
LICDGAGACVGCNAPSDCAGSDDECKARTCVSGACGVAFTAANTPVAAQTPGDCKLAACNGSGGVGAILDPTDLPADDGNPCTAEVCSAGTPGHPAIADGQVCNDGDACTQTDTCQSGACVGANPIACSGGLVCVAGSCSLACYGMLGPPLVPALSVGQFPVDIVSGDLNGDGAIDLVVANHNGQSVSVLLNLGNASFAPAVNYPAGGFVASIALADLNGDGRPDLALTTSGGNSVRVMLNLGNGTLGPASNYAVAMTMLSVAVADFNGDGKPDLVTSNNQPATSLNQGDVGVLFNQGNGIFGPVVHNLIKVDPLSIAAADVNGDGHPDLVLAHYTNVGSVGVMLNQGNGALAPEVNYPTGSSSNAVVAADLNGDGHPDLALANYGSNNVSVLLNLGNGTFGAAVNFAVGVTPASVAAVDLDGDGHLDLAVANGGSNTVSVLHNLGNGTFGAAVNHAVTGQPSWVVGADLDGDGAPDLAVTSSVGNKVSVLLNNTCGP